MPVTAESNFQFFWQDRSVSGHFRSGVSLHSHTMFSEEGLDMVPRYTAKVPYLGRAIRRQEAEYSAKKGRKFDFNNAFWTPPLAPRQAYRLEEKQIQRQFQLPGLISLTDHDDTRAGTLLHILNRLRKIPISTEWTIPYGPTFFHLGVHNIPADKVPEVQAKLTHFTDHADPETLSGYLEMLNAFPDTLIVLNHPLWDEKGIGLDGHKQVLADLLARHGHSFHALEVNGLRSWSENRDVIEMGRSANFPVVSGGDRHGREPNAILNFSAASSFEEFVGEVRRDRRSDVVFMPQYHEPLRLRVLHTMVDVVRDYPENIEGRRLWSDRVFYRDPISGHTTPLTAIWQDGGPRIVRHFIGAMGLVHWPGVKSALRMALDDRSVVWSDREASV